jgi:signal transduction histidine kinase
MNQKIDPKNGNHHQDSPLNQPTNGRLERERIADELFSTATAWSPEGDEASLNEATRFFLIPAIRLMNRLRYPQKFALIGLLVAIPLGWILAEYVIGANQDIDFAIREQHGVDYLTPVAKLLQDVQKHMALTDAVLQGNTEFEAAANSIRDEIEQDIAAVGIVNDRYGSELSLNEAWQAVRSEWQQLHDDLPGLDQQQSFERHGALLEHIEEFMVVIGNNSQLILDPNIDTYYLMDTLVIQIPRATNYYSRVRVYGLHLQTGEALTPADQTSLVAYSHLARSAVTANQRGLQYVFDFNPQIETQLSDTLTRSLSALNDLDLALMDGASDSSNSGEDLDVALYSAEVYRVVTLAIDERFTLYDEVSSTLNDLLLARVNRLTQTRNGALWGMLAVVGVMVYLFWGFYWSVHDVIGSLKELSHHDSSKLRDPQNLIPDNIDELAQGVRATAARLAVVFEDLGDSIRQARQATAAAHEANRLKSEFLATMSHELRTPLNAMIGFSRIMLAGMGGALDDDARGMVERIDANSQRLLNLINDILDLSRIEAQRVDIARVAFSPQRMIEDLCRSMQSLAATRGLEFEYRIDPAMPKELVGDPSVIERVATNLLSNSFKFTNEGRVTLNVMRSINRDEWTITVADTGIGIPAHAREFIFDPFRQVDGSSQRAYGGSGLGLAIVKELVRAMGGTIYVESAVGRGSVFVVNLPLSLSVTDLVEHAEL